jgi:hypothetical protein
VAALLSLAACQSSPIPTKVPTDESIAGLSPVGTVTLTETFVGGFAGGSGVVTYQGKKHPFKVVGTIFGPGGSVSKLSVAGEVYKLDDISQFAGAYAQGTGKPGVETSGASDLWLENINGETIVITAKAVSAKASCPLCKVASQRIHSRYVRRLSDLPCAGRSVRLDLVARRFRCEQPLCRRQIFAERFDNAVVPARSRRTARLESIVHVLGLALGGRPGASVAKPLMLPVSNDTLLRTVRRRSQRPTQSLKVVGIDDWAFRRNHRYGSIVCDLERRRIVALLPDREVSTVRLGSPAIRRLRSCLAIAAVAMVRRRRRHWSMRCRSLTDGT